MSKTEKIVAGALAVVLVAMVGAYFVTQKPASGADAAACTPTGGGGGYAETQEFGEEGAPVEIIALVPVALGCHQATEEELKKAYEAHPDGIHLVIADLFGPEAEKYMEKLGVQFMAVSINGKMQFELDGRPVRIQMMEGMSYRPSDIVPIVEQELARLS